MTSIATPLRTAIVAILVIPFLLLAGCTNDSGNGTAIASPTSSGTATASATPTAAAGLGQALSESDAFADLVASVGPSVVLIESVPAAVSGSGSVIDTQGHILTNYHVVENQTQVKVTLPDGSASLATIVGTDPDNDLAVLLADGFDAEQLQPVTFGDSDTIRPGETVFAIGSPFSQRFTVTRGIVSAIERKTTSLTGRAIRDVIQTDAALNPGNSGGPLFNLKGEVVGVNSSIENPEGRVFVGLGFAVPSNTVVRYIPEMKTGATIKHAQLGVTVAQDALDEVVAAQLGLSVDRGLVVEGVQPGSAAARAGIQVQDVLVSANGAAIASFEDLARAIDKAEVGDEITVIVQRGAEELALAATLQASDLTTQQG